MTGKFVPVTATKGKVVKAFASITEAAKWIHKNRKVAEDTAKANICSASLGRENRALKNKRKAAYGYTWTRNEQ